MTDTRDEAVTPEILRAQQIVDVWLGKDGDAWVDHPGCRRARPLVVGIAAEIATLSAQLAEAQEARDLNAAALECYSAEQARLRKELAEVQAELNMWRASFPGSAEAVKRDSLEKLK